ncbi:zinc finger and SCAN domain-containing protein 12-like isoform X2 [Nerophis ophidion]|uniref:zinc finger and SCAN domain-containing protein 12-like isoform X2 n=1 Tax=Nerophis ophidion TaxID=159077 RepID=UPI002ADF6F80|nr:zinc finger and SCAN domain-containing protein 12-like isoform X2 [Nerophis ophidion]
MDDYCYAKMVTSCQRESERESAPPTENNLKSQDEDVQQLIGRPEELPPQLVESFTLKQETPQPPCIKKEEEELCITKEGECLLGPREAGLTRFPLTVVFVKTEDDEEKPQVDNLLAPLSDSEAEDEAEEPLSIKTNSEDVQQLMGHPEEVSPQSGGSSTLKQETPQPPCIKKEEEELCITQEGECLLGREEADYTKFPLTVVSVKTEDDEEKPQVDNLLAPLSDSEAEDEVEEPLSSDTDCEGEEKPQEDNLLAPLSESDSEDGFEEPLSGDPDWEGDIRTHTNNKRPECADKKRGKKGFSCSICANSFSKRRHLTQHMKTHTVGKTFNCSVCGKIFVSKGGLTKHLLTHTGLKPFNCSVCSKSFSYHSSLTEHIRTHTGEKPFKCSVCDKRFCQKTNLTKHMRLHTGDKKFTCSVCGKSFSYKSNLTPCTACLCIGWGHLCAADPPPLGMVFCWLSCERDSRCCVGSALDWTLATVLDPLWIELSQYHVRPARHPLLSSTPRFS